MSLADAKPLYSFGSVDPGPARPSWIAINYPVHIGACPGWWDMFAVNADTGDFWLVPGMQAEEPAVEREIRRIAS